MSLVAPLGSYRGMRSPLGRLRPGAKLLGLFVFSIAVVWAGGPVATSVALAVALALTLLAGMRWGELWRVTRGFLLIAVLLSVFTAASTAFGLHTGFGAGAGVWVEAGGVDATAGSGQSATSIEGWWPGLDAWGAGALRAYEVVGDLFALILAASAVTASTALEDMLDTITWSLGPLRRFGVNPERVALAFSLMIRAIPSILGIAHETRAAARARGLERHPRALVVPLALRTVAHAQLTGEALAARGIGEE